MAIDPKEAKEIREQCDELVPLMLAALPQGREFHGNAIAMACSEVMATIAYHEGVPLERIQQILASAYAYVVDGHREQQS